MIKQIIARVLGIAPAVVGSSLRAGPIAVPNGSFESPVTGFVSVMVDSWQKSPKPAWYREDGTFLWTQLIGLFKNTLPTSPDHIDNCDGNQAVWLFAVPELALFEDYDTTPAFDATYDVGKSYQLTVGVIGAGGGMQPGAALDLSLYYRDAASHRVAVAVTSITNTTDIFTNDTHLIDFSVSAPTVKASDPWAGKHIGIQMLSTVTTNLQGGYWDLDNVRLTAVEQPSLLHPVLTGGQFQFTVQSEPGLTIEILSSTNLALPLASWASAVVVTNTVGNMTYTGKASAAAQFYQAVRLAP